MRRLTVFGLCLGATVLASCGKSPAGADSVVRSVASVTITPADDFLLVGGTVQFSASATLDDGTSAGRSGTWGSDTPAVATVDATGKVTALTRGKATIYVDVEGRRGTRLVTVAPNLNGEWGGSYGVGKCTATGDFKSLGFCEDPSAGEADSIALHLAQNRTTLSGSVEFPTCPCAIDVMGTVSDDGLMVVTGSTGLEPFAVTLKNWATRSDQPGVMTGTFSINITASGLGGSGTLDSRLMGVSRTSGGPSSLQGVRVAPGAGRIFDALRRWMARTGR